MNRTETESRDRRINVAAIVIILIALLACYYGIQTFRTENACVRLTGEYGFVVLSGYGFCIDESNLVLIPSGVRWRW